MGRLSCSYEMVCGDRILTGNEPFTSVDTVTLVQSMEESFESEVYILRGRVGAFVVSPTRFRV